MATTITLEGPNGPETHFVDDPNETKREIAAAEQRGEARGREKALREVARWLASERAGWGGKAEYAEAVRTLLDRLRARCDEMLAAEPSGTPDSSEEIDDCVAEAYEQGKLDMAGECLERERVLRNTMSQLAASPAPPPESRREAVDAYIRAGGTWPPTESPRLEIERAAVQRFAQVLIEQMEAGVTYESPGPLFNGGWRSAEQHWSQIAARLAGLDAEGQKP